MLRKEIEFKTDKPVLILVDIQNEYLKEDGQFFLHGIGPSLENCKKMLIFAREQAWNIVHVQHSNGDHAEHFNPKTIHFNFMKGFVPKVESENHFIKNDYSCYSSEDFATYMGKIAANDKKPAIYLIGYNSLICCLSTLEEARRKKDMIHFIAEASLAKALPDKSEIETHEIMVQIYNAKNLTKIMTTAEVKELHSQKKLHDSYHGSQQITFSSSNAVVTPALPAVASQIEDIAKKSINK